MVNRHLIQSFTIETDLTQFFAQTFTWVQFAFAIKSQIETELGTVMGLIRKIVVIGGAFLAMPSPPQTSQTAAVTPSSSWTFITAAADTFSDFKGFCDRKPQVCVTAQYLAVSVEGKAKYSAKLLYEWASESTPPALQGAAELAKVDPIKTSALGPELASIQKGTSTLHIEDLVPEWHGTLLPEKG